jgi:hypothetical protein
MVIRHRCVVIRLAVIAVISLIGVQIMHAQESCKDVLSIGLRDTYNVLYSYDRIKALHDWNSSEQSRDFWQSQKDGFSVGVGDVKVGNDSQSGGGAKVTIKNQSDFQTFASDKTFEQTAQSILSPTTKDAIAAWRDCMNGGDSRSNNGVTARILNYSPDDNKFTIRIQWRNVQAAQRVPYIDSYALSNATCPQADDRLKKGIILGRKAVSDIDLQCTRTSKVDRVTFSIQTDQGPMQYDAIIPAYSPPPTGHCSTSCSSCVLESNNFECRECKITLKDSFESKVDHKDLSQGPSGIRFSCGILPKNASYVVRASGTISADYTTIFFKVPFHVGDDIGTGDKVQWWIDARYKIDDPPETCPGYSQTKLLVREVNGAWADCAVIVPASGTIAGGIYLEHSQISPSEVGPTSFHSDFVISIKPQ